MERLTTRDANCADPKVLYGVYVKNHDYISAANRLADYEDTGLTPEEIEKLRGQPPRWIPVEERRPEYNVRVLVIDVYAGEGDEFIAIWTREEYPDDPEDGCWIDDRGWWHAFDEVTHWMPLPEPPEEERSKQ